MKMSDNQSIVKGSSFYAYAEARTLQLCRHKRGRLRQWKKKRWTKYAL